MSVRLPVMLLPVMLLFATAPLVAQWTSIPLPEAGRAWRIGAALGDLDGDGIEDLVISRNGTFAVRQGTARAPRRFAADERVLSAEVAPSCENAGQPRLVDVDGDGDLDLLAVDGPMASQQRLVWFANDGAGGFAAAKELRGVGGAKLQRHSEVRAVDLTDWNADGHLDLLLASPQVVVHLGGAQGFATASIDLGVRGDSLAVADWNRDGQPDLLTVLDGELFVHLHDGDRLGPPARLAEVIDEPGPARLCVADWNGDGRVDVLLGEAVREQPAPVNARTPMVADEDQQRLRAAEAVLAVIDAEIARLNQSRPPRDDAAAMQRRVERREELLRWAAGPQELREQLRVLRLPRANQSTGAVRVLQQ